MRANLKLTPQGYDTTILLDGVDVTNAVCGLTLRASVGELTQLTLDVELVEGAALGGEVDVMIPAETRELLERLGWTAPREAVSA